MFFSGSFLIPRRGEALVRFFAKKQARLIRPVTIEKDHQRCCQTKCVLRHHQNMAMKRPCFCYLMHSSRKFALNQVNGGKITIVTRMIIISLLGLYQ